MAAVQKGTTLKISFGSFSYTGYVPEEVTVSKPNGNVEVLRDADGATMTKIFMDPLTRMTFTTVILSTGSITPPIEGAELTITEPSGTLTTWNCESAEVRHTAGATKLTMTVVNPQLTTA
jgi:hypothetical protein